MNNREAMDILCDAMDRFKGQELTAILRAVTALSMTNSDAVSLMINCCLPQSQKEVRGC